MSWLSEFPVPESSPVSCPLNPNVLQILMCHLLVIPFLQKVPVHFKIFNSMNCFILLAIFEDLPSSDPEESMSISTEDAPPAGRVAPSGLSTHRCGTHAGRSQTSLICKCPNQHVGSFHLVLRETHRLIYCCGCSHFNL